MNLNELFDEITKSAELYIASWVFVNDINELGDMIFCLPDDIFDALDEIDKNQFNDQLNVNFKKYSNTQPLNTNILYLIAQQISLKNGLFNNNLNDDLAYLLQLYSKNNNQYNGKIYWVNTQKELKKHPDLKKLRQYDGIIISDDIIKNLFSDDKNKYQKAVENLINEIDNSKPDVLLKTIDTKINIDRTASSHLENLPNQLRNYIIGSFEKTQQSQYKYLYIPNSLIDNNYGKWDDNTFDFKIVDGNGVAFQISLKNKDLSTMQKTILLISSKSKFESQHRKVSKIEVFQTDSLKTFNENVKLNNKIIKLSFDNSKSHITYKGEILDAMGLSKFGKEEQQLFKDNYKNYKKMAEDINNNKDTNNKNVKNSLSEQQVFKIVLDIYKAIQINNSNKYRDIPNIIEQMQEIKETFNIQNKKYGIQLMPREKQEEIYKKFLNQNDRFTIAKKQINYLIDQIMK